MWQAPDSMERNVGLKENMAMVKEELNSEEQFFEQAVKTERFVKKHKMKLIAAGVAVVAAIVVTAGMNMLETQKKREVNAAYTLLLSSPQDAAAAKTLQSEAPALYDAWRLQRALSEGDVTALESLVGSSSSEVADISRYELAAANKDATALGKYAYGQDAIFKELAIIDEAVLLMKAGKSDEAHLRLKMIGSEGLLYPLASALMHYGVK